MFGELRTSVELQINHGDVRAQDHVRHDGLFHQVWALTFAARIFMGSDVGVGPAVEAALLNVSEIIGDQVIAEQVALLYGGPESVASGIPVNSGGVARSGGEDFVTAAIGIEAINGGAHGRIA